MSASNQLVVKVIAVTAVTTLVFAGIIFYFIYRYALAQERQKNRFASSFRREAVVDQQNLTHQGKPLQRLVVDENHKDVLRLHKLEAGKLARLYTTGFDHLEEEKRVISNEHIPMSIKSIQQVPIPSDTSNIVDYRETKKAGQILPPLQYSRRLAQLPYVKTVKQTPPPPPSPPPPAQSPSPPPPLPPPAQSPPPPPPLPPPLSLRAKKFQGPHLPPVVAKKNHPSLPPLKPPPAPIRKVNSSNSRIESSRGKRSKANDEVEMKMKPLHWDKVTTNVDHSLVWNEIGGGSFRFDDELIESLFGYNTNKKKSPEMKNISSNTGICNSKPPDHNLLLDPRRSQNTAIVLKSLAIPREEILDALIEGRGLDADTLEKLTKISPSQEEAAKILQFKGNHAKLADAEAFLYQILKSVPSAFVRINAMLFRSNYDPDILHLKQSLQSIEFGCKELRVRGIFLKLLEAILKAGNRMNAGTTRGNAQGFNLNALRKISYVKSTDGKTTLLDFVVEQVARAEGKRSVMNRFHGSGRCNIQVDNDTNQDLDNLTHNEERNKEYLMLGLPVLVGLSTEFSNVKKAAAIDSNYFTNECQNIIARVSEIRQLVTECGNDKAGDFIREMKGFIEDCEEELKVVREEQARVMQLVKRTTEFYQAGASKEIGAHPLQIFIFVKDFLDMVDQACMDITRKLQKQNVRTVESSRSISPSTRASVIFQNMQLFSKAGKPVSSSFSDSEEDF